MNRLCFIFLFGLIVLNYSCKKDNSGEQANNLIKVVQTEEEYMTEKVFNGADGEIVMFCTSIEDRDIPDSYGKNPSLFVRISPEGDVIARIALPDIVFNLWTAVELRNGGYFIAGTGPVAKSEEIGCVIINSVGTVQSQYTFSNQSSLILSIDGPLSGVSALQLNDGRIILLNSALSGFNQPIVPRIHVFDENLNVLQDKLLYANSIVPNRHQFLMSVSADNNQDLLLIGRLANYTNDTIIHNEVILRVNSQNYEADYGVKLTDTLWRIPSEMTCSPGNDLIWAYAGPTAADTNYTTTFNFRNQERCSIGDKITINSLNTQTGIITKKSISGFPKKGFVRAIKACNDGGYILTGACNINANQKIASDYRILLIKTDASFNLEWMRIPETSNPCIAWDITESDYGYLLAVTQLNHRNNNQAAYFHFNKNGFLN
ncbi:MAG: hypothetical protein R2850_12490 [Bacteroidia bacterium]